MSNNNNNSNNSNRMAVSLEYQQALQRWRRWASRPYQAGEHQAGVHQAEAILP